MRPALAAREDDAPVEGVAALRVEQAETPQEIERIALSREMTAQARAWGVADPQFFDRGGVVQSALPKIAQCLGVAIELLLIESGGLFEHGGRVGWRSALLLEVSEALAEGKMAGQLDKAQEIGLDWWRYDRYLSPGNQTAVENEQLKEQIRLLERRVIELTTRRRRRRA